VFPSIVRFGVVWSFVTGLSLKGASEGGGKKEYLNYA